MSATPLLNSSGSAAACARKMMAEAQTQVMEAEKMMLTRRMGSYEEYLTNFTKLQSLKGLQTNLQEIYDRTFNV